MTQFLQKKLEVFGIEKAKHSQKRRNRLLAFFMLLSSVWSYVLVFHAGSLLSHARPSEQKFYHHVVRPQVSCAIRNDQPISYAGYVGLEGDTEEIPKRSFFWYFEAENKPEDAPIVLSFGGGPGTSGLMNGLFALSPCTVTSSGLVRNIDRWNEQFNLILLDHPVNVGLSYGPRINNSHDAALDVYDFLQKFFKLFPRLEGNKFIIVGGSYGGVYIPNIASVIHRKNKAIAAKQESNLIPIKLDSMMITNPLTNPLVHYQWVLEYRCQLHQLYNSTTCAELSSLIPRCSEMIELAYQFSTLEYRAQATEKCFFKIEGTQLQGDIVKEDIRRTCRVSNDDPVTCHPEFKWANDYFNSSSVKETFGVPVERDFIALNPQVAYDFHAYGDLMQPHHELYIPLLEDGVRLLHYVGAQDGNCPWPGTFSMLKLLRSPHQKAFLEASEFLWNSGLNETVTVRRVGSGAGDFTFMLIDQAGHFVANDQPKLAKLIAEHWINNIEFLPSDRDAEDDKLQCYVPWDESDSVTKRPGLTTAIFDLNPPMGKVEVLYEVGKAKRKSQNRRNKLLVVFLLFSCVCWSYALVFHARSRLHVRSPQRKFYHRIVQPQLSCATRDNQSISYAGHIGLDGDSQETPKRSFFWYFEAENKPEDAPIILNFGGGPGTSGLMNGFLALSPCTMTSSGPVHNTNRWTEQFNLILLDHPINVGFSHGPRVNNSHDAALDVYDFLQKFFRLFPQLQGNRLIIAGGSYGGVYVPTIASVIHKQNKAIAVNKYSNLIPINLDSMMVSNPVTNPLVHYQWAWEYRCNLHQLHNSTTCSELSSIIPRCLESIELAYQFSTVEYRVQATENCFFKIEGLPLQGDVVREDIRRTCKGSEDDPTTCHPEFKWMNDFFNSSSVKKSLGIPVEREYIALNVQVAVDFHAYGDLMQPHHELYTPLLEDGIRLLHYIGAQDGNCPWPGTYSMVKLLPNPFQEEFLAAPEFIWSAGLDEKVTIRQAGNGAGNLTFMLIDQAGHFVADDQPKLAKLIAEHWINNREFLSLD